jgi:hypothetical protein
MVLTAVQRQQLTELYYDPSHGLTHANKLYKKVDGVSLKDIKVFIKQQELGQLYHQRNQKKFYPITAPPDSYQADLIFFYDKTINNGYDTALTLIEITSRRGYCYPMKGKATKQVMAVFNQFLNDVDNKVDNLTTDKGSEFTSRTFKALIRRTNIKHFTADEGDHSKMGMIERFNQTVKALISKYLTAYKTKKYIDALPDLMYNYNHTVHSGIGYAPVDVSDIGGALIRIKAREKTRHLDDKKNLNVGDKVRVRKERGLFQKGGRRWTNEVFTITEDHIKSFEIDDDTNRRHKHYNLLKIVVPADANPYKRKIKSYDVETQLQEARKRNQEVPRAKPASITPRPRRVKKKKESKEYEYEFSHLDPLLGIY